jgi:hypothetical protein
MADDERDPGFLSGGIPPAGGHVSVALRLHRALAALDDAAPRTVGACRAAALRYLETLQQQDVGPGSALRLLRVAAGASGPADYTMAERLRLDARLHFWVGTVYRLRWVTAAGDAAPPEPGP